MKLPRDVSGRHLAGVLCLRWGYTEAHRAGSHIILQTEDPGRHRIAIPDHASLRIGTLSAILRSVAQAKHVPREDIIGTI
jgi:predicted RNA binding protein YcfA (HicA-like mRNA interferase family)